ncbi:hypothetical protein BBK82_40450 [Lentzea guizhouensis]|uniref:Uncharacterized protein n=1 Tax=Lentzea guizhouensis TaxID=1586287 RepID=A0A1B2HU97_9PSEU|nr:hypothetical protein [Lentzea guizhouensis]ANZ41309.1 hypothetical protein BBK82_40450 [Lentzea guizhouensis]
MDKIVGELLGPFARRLAASASIATVTFWVVGVVLFFWLHPQPLPGCPSGGKDLCGALTGGWARAVPLLACLTGAMVLSYCLLFSQATSATSVLTGADWPRWPGRAGRWLESKRRKHTKRQAALTPPVRRAQAGLRWFPHGQPGHVVREAEGDDPALEPTRLGNVFAAATQHVRDQHGMELNACWRHLLAVASPTEITNLEFASRVLLGHAQAVLWLLASLFWVPLLPGTTAKLVATAALLWLARVFYRRMCQAAAHYCDGLETVIQAHAAELLKRAGRSVSLPSQRSLRLRRPAG